MIPLGGQARQNQPRPRTHRPVGVAEQQAVALLWDPVAALVGAGLGSGFVLELVFALGLAELLGEQPVLAPVLFAVEPLEQLLS